MLGPVRSAVLVDAEEREIERVPGIGEVVRVPPEESQLQLDRLNETDVREAAEHVCRVASTVVERDDLHPDRVAPIGVGLTASLPDTVEGLRPSLFALIRRSSIQRSEDLIGDILDRDQLVGIEALDPPLIVQRSGIEAAVQQVLARSARSAHGAAHAVVVGRDQAIRRDERCRAAGNAKN
ncbi:MAG: hypothetical protein P8Y07_02485 [Gemmatimonadales bacterium]